MEHLNFTTAQMVVIALVLIALVLIFLVVALPKQRAERLIRLVRTVLRLLPITAICQAVISIRNKSEDK